MTPLHVIHEDNHCLVVLKPFGLPSQGDSSGDASLLDHCKAYIARKYDKPGRVFLGLVHRLDRPAGGLIVLARTSKGAERLSRQFRQRSVLKRYRLCVHGAWTGAPQGSARHWLLKDRRRNTVRRVEQGHPGALEALLDYRVLAVYKDRSEVEVRLHSGRPHQIRVQLAALGHPLLGDLRYGAPSPLPERRIALWSWRLAFEAPVGGERLDFRRLPEPEELGLPSFGAGGDAEWS